MKHDFNVFGGELNGTFYRALSYPGKGLKHKKVHIKSLQIKVYSHGYFSRNNDSSSQVGYMIFLTEKYDNANLIDYASDKSRRLIMSVLVSETFALADASDSAIIIQHNLKHI